MPSFGNGKLGPHGAHEAGEWRLSGLTFAGAAKMLPGSVPPSVQFVRTPVDFRGERVLLHHATTAGVPESAGPLLLLHGMASSWRQWRTTMLRLGPEIPLAALDLPGFGDSGLTRQPLATEDFADVAEAWCRARGWPPLAAIGHSFGGAVLIDWASRYPERFRALGLLAPAAIFHDWYTAGWAFLRRPVLGPLVLPLFIWLISTQAVGRKVFGHIVSDFGLLQADEFGDLQWGCRHAREMRRALNYYHFKDLDAHLERIRCPVTIGWGTHDRVVPYSDAQVYAKHLPDARLLTWDGCGHVPMLERRDACDDLLRSVWTGGSDR